MWGFFLFSFCKLLLNHELLTSMFLLSIIFLFSRVFNLTVYILKTLIYWEMFHVLIIFMNWSFYIDYYFKVADISSKSLEVSVWAPAVEVDAWKLFSGSTLFSTTSSNQRLWVFPNSLIVDGSWIQLQPNGHESMQSYALIKAWLSWIRGVQSVARCKFQGWIFFLSGLHPCTPLLRFFLFQFYLFF